LTRSVLVVIFCAVLAGSACALTPTSNSLSSGTPAASSSRAGGGVNLDPEVPMPGTFPSDMPIYSGARLTSAINFGSNGTTTWGMEWETVDGVDKVQTFYTARLAEGDWSLSFPTSADGAFSATFNRKSNSKVGGILGINASSGITKISLALTNGG
jgi:hypothetical protein